MVGAVLTIFFSYVLFPLIFIGPLIGGFLSSYLSKGYEDYKGMDEKDGMVVGAITGLIGGLIISLFFIVGIGDISPIIELIGATGDNIIIKGYIIIQFSLIISLISGLVGGVLGVTLKK